MPKYIDLTGQRFGRLTAIQRHADRISPNGSARTMWLCRCDCGKEAIVNAGHLRCGKTRSCGCLIPESLSARRKTHGGSYTVEYRNWRGMLTRCYNRNNPAYPNYGGRGITVCDAWRQSFSQFLEDMGERPSSGASVDRMDNDGPYSPQNCRWSTHLQQANNRRSNRIISVFGQTRTVMEWSRVTGISRRSIVARIDRFGWSPERAVSQPTQ